MFNKISVKIILLVVVTTTLMALCIAVIAWRRIAETSHDQQKQAAVNILRLVTRNIQTQYDQLVDFEVEFVLKRRELLKQENATLLAYLDVLGRMAREGRIPEEQAKKLALEWVESQRKPDRDTIVFDMNLTSLSQADRSMVGSTLTGFRNIRGTDAFAYMRERLDTASQQYSVIFWPSRPGGPQRKQLGFFSSFPAWGWIIARTEPIDDLEAVMASKREAILKDVSRTLSETMLPGGGYLFMFQGNGNMLIHPALSEGLQADLIDPELFESLKKISSTPGVHIHYVQTHPGTRSPRGKIAFVEYFKPLDWYVCYSLLEKDLETAATSLIRDIMGIILASAVLTIATLLFFLRRFTKPVSDLTSLVGTLPAQDFVLNRKSRDALDKMSGRRSDEIGSLARVFTGVFEKLQKHLEELARLSRERSGHIAALEDAKLELESRVAERTANLQKTNDLLTTQMRQKEEAVASLRASEEKFRLLAETMPGIVYLARWGEGLTMLFLNDYTTRLTGYPKEDFLNGLIRFTDLVHPEDLPAVIHQAKRAVEANSPYRLEYRLRRKDGQWLWLEDHGRGVHSGQEGVSYVEGVINDVTDRVEARDHLEAAKDQAEQASRAKSDFLANMSHEIRTPLNTVLGMASLLAETDLSPAQNRYVANLTSSGRQLLDLISDILDFSRIESGKIDLAMAPFDVGRVLDDVAAVVRPAAGKKNLDFQAVMDLDLWPWRLGDMIKLRQVLVNLASNAVKFTHEGRVLITVSPSGEGKDHVLFRIKDTGEGIPEEKQRAVFEKFTQADALIHPRHGGTGLGLTISQRLVQAMGGTIRLESQPGAGSTFFFSLPLPRADAATKAPPDAGRARPLPGPFLHLRVLIAEDVPANREVVQLYLEGKQFDLTFAGDGLEALELCRTNQYDVVLMDIEMPEMDGLEATRRIRAMERETGRPPARIYALTAHAFAEFQTDCLAAGCTGFLTKPVTRDALEDALSDREPVFAKGPAVESTPTDLGGLVERIPEKFESLMPVFFQSVDQHLAEAQASLLKKDWPALARIGHSLKGTAATYSIRGLSSLGAELEAAARRQDLTTAGISMDKLRNARNGMTIEYYRD